MQYIINICRMPNHSRADLYNEKEYENMENELDSPYTKEYNNLNNRNEKIVPDLYEVPVVLWPRCMQMNSDGRQKIYGSSEKETGV